MSGINMLWWGFILLIGILIFVFFGQSFLRLSKWMWYGIFHMAVGGILIYLINLGGQFVHFHIPLNPITAIVIGILGLPGLMAFIIIKFFITPV
ncbi:pro-sigmaK processing inhibitor BofA family protein [Tepidibacillus fermentans]|uniref:Inhibitor of the pro-sigma K processing machinery n=1 Tax=Tepidibacillus fermentans TaxID=1281767 RepID=A0A4R3K5T0_9BACI|nr:pro-sigmaK processing inhibitor BofA family protein [Tepidibacillus fermentans]TCS78143.1 inhibitor of the pro-sigma K processing machinery [Tepidibacillus fermentans]